MNATIIIAIFGSVTTLIGSLIYLYVQIKKIKLIKSSNETTSSSGYVLITKKDNRRIKLLQNIFLLTLVIMFFCFLFIIFKLKDKPEIVKDSLWTGYWNTLEERDGNKMVQCKMILKERNYKITGYSINEKCEESSIDGDIISIDSVSGIWKNKIKPIDGKFTFKIFDKNHFQGTYVVNGDDPLTKPKKWTGVKSE
jgi:hypothetical protein